MFYDGIPQSSDNTRQPAAIGHATSNDGMVWERAGEHPILTADDVPFADFEVNAGPVFVDDGVWTMIFSTVDDANFSSGVIGQATATDPDGAWEIETEPIVVNGESGAWDSRFIFASSVVRDEDGYWLYYTGFGDERGGAIGLATSADGIVWEKQPDPIVVERGSAGDWDGGEVIQPFVRQTDAGFEMFFMGLNRGFSGASVGYATSENGIEWTKFEDNPVVSNEDGEDWVFLSRPQAVVIDDGSYRLFFTVVHSTDRENAVYLAVGIVR
jgi:predicted GH43/DUF377 family glycosyl hydrolase